MGNISEYPGRSSESKIYKSSRYNHFFPGNDGCILAYNAFSNSFARITEKNYDIIKKILEKPNHLPYEKKEHSKLKNDLIRGGFLIDYHFDEFEVLKAQNQIGRFANRNLSLTIAPTLKCNFNCTYCFENPKSDTMTPPIEKALIKFVDMKLEGLRGLHISWFGGEPLLEIDRIERLSDAFENICFKHKVELNQMGIITNGFLLGKDTAERLQKINIKTAQVTIDGIAETHDKRRKLKNGQGTFWKILENIKKSVDILRIYIRINIDKENAHTLEDFYELWKKEGLIEKVPFYFGQVRSSSNACADIASQCFSTKEYSRLVIELLIKARNMGISNLMYPNLNKAGFCIADNLNGYVVAPSGYLFKCWEEISSDEDDSIGHLFEVEPSPPQIMNHVKYLNWAPFSIEKCKRCNVFPVCSGGCLHNSLRSLDNRDCNFWKYNLEEMLTLKYDEINQRKRNKGG
jgi:uncharacterized protein